MMLAAIAVRSGRELLSLFLIKYGLVAVFVAAMAEADAIPVLAGVAAHLGYFEPLLAIFAGSAGAFSGDCLWFFLGRYRWIQRSELFRRIRPKGEVLFRRVGNWQIPASHVVYGTRVATMVFLGARGSSFARFAVVDGLACLVLTTVLFLLGFGLSASASVILLNVKRIEFGLLAMITLCGLSFYLLQKLRRRLLE
jgi:membrane protein DedA with SNARE-associated domain